MHHVLTLLLALDARARRIRPRVTNSARSGRSGQCGQATVEYALVVLGAATIAILLLTWAAETGRISALLERVMDLVSEQAG